MTMKIRNHIENVASEGIEADIISALGVSNIPQSLTAAIRGRVYQAYRDTMDMVRAQAGTEMTRILDRAFE